MRKSLVVLIAVIIAAMLCGCADDVSSVQQEDSSSRSSTKWTVTKVADDDISCEGLVLTALNSGDFPEMVKATDSTLLDTIMDFSKYGITDYCVYQQAISVELSEIIAVRADDTDGVKAALQSRKDSLIKQFGTYPEQEKIVSRTVVFQKGDLCFLIARKSLRRQRKQYRTKSAQTLLIRGIKKSGLKQSKKQKYIMTAVFCGCFFSPHYLKSRQKNAIIVKVYRQTLMSVGWK